MPENIEAANIYNLVQDQVLVAGMENKIIGINQLAVWKAIEAYKVENPIKVFEKIMWAFRKVNNKEEVKE
ncbi:MAG: hypothetical protein KJ888_20790 [Gammaproteobacteria bacterium]|nr:hypothetical protein [Gammaproteobacteria bacterium]